MALKKFDAKVVGKTFAKEWIGVTLQGHALKAYFLKKPQANEGHICVVAKDGRQCAGGVCDPYNESLGTVYVGSTRPTARKTIWSLHEGVMCGR